MAQLLSGTRIYGTGTVDTQLLINGSIAATNTTSGALQVVGGAGIGGNLYVGGTLYASAVTGSITTATNLSAGSTGTLVFQSNVGQTAYVPAGTAGQLLVSAGTTSTGPTFTNTSSIRVGYSNTSTNLSSGSTGSVVYQSAVGTTAFLAASTSGYLLSTQGPSSAPTWISQASLTAGGVDTIKTIADSTNATYYPTLVNSNNASGLAESLYTTSSFNINPGTGNVGIGVTTATSKLDVNGSVKISGVTTITDTTVASSTVTGALQVGGGAGIGGNLWLGGDVNIVKASTNIIMGNSSLASTGTATIILGRSSLGDAATIKTYDGPNTNLRIFNGVSGRHLDLSSYATNGWGPTGTNDGARIRIDGATGDVKILNTSSSISTTTGALQVTGGVGIGGDLFIGGSIYGSNGIIGTTGTTSTFIIRNATSATSTNTGALQVVNGGAGIGGSLYVGGLVTGGSIRTTSSGTAPLNPTVGDIWYNTTTDIIYRYTSDGTTSVWLDITGPTSTSSSTFSLGVGQSWTDVTATRAFGVTYTNTTGKPIFVQGRNSAYGGTLLGTFYVNGNTVAQDEKYAPSARVWVSTMGGIVPPGATYQITIVDAGNSASLSLGAWWELR